MKGAGPRNQNIEELRRRLREQVSEDDVASEEECDDPGYLENSPDWITSPADYYRFIARQVGRARINSDKSDMDRYTWADTLTFHAELVYNFKKEEGMSDEQIAKEFENYFSGLEKRCNKDYFERIGNAKVVRRGMSMRELESIARGTWEKTANTDERRWLDVTVNKEVARRFARRNTTPSKPGVIIEIDMDSIRDKLVSPGYTARTIFAKPKDDINESDSLMRGLFNEEHHLPPDIDLREARMRITIVAFSSSQKRSYIDELENLNIKNWVIDLK